MNKEICINTAPLLVVGSVAIDNIINPFGEFPDVLGGSASYFSCSASYFTGVKMVGVVGKDFSSEHIDFFKSKNIDLAGLDIVEGETFTWKGKYTGDLGSAETLDVALNVFADFNPILNDEYKKSKYVFLANISPQLQKNVLSQLESPELIVMDTMDHWIENQRDELLEVIKMVDILILNEGEANLLTGESSLILAGKAILKMGPKKVIVKKGAEGAYLMSATDYFCIPSYPVEKVVDTTGAGDTFGGGFMGYLIKTNDLADKNLRKAVVYGTVMSSFTVEDVGLNRIGNVSEDEIESRYEEIRGICNCPV